MIAFTISGINLLFVLPAIYAKNMNKDNRTETKKNYITKTIGQKLKDVPIIK